MAGPRDAIRMGDNVRTHGGIKAREIKVEEAQASSERSSAPTMPKLFPRASLKVEAYW